MLASKARRKSVSRITVCGARLNMTSIMRRRPGEAKEFSAVGIRGLLLCSSLNEL